MMGCTVVRVRAAAPVTAAVVAAIEAESGGATRLAVDLGGAEEVAEDLVAALARTAGLVAVARSRDIRHRLADAGVPVYDSLDAALDDEAPALRTGGEGEPARGTLPGPDIWAPAPIQPEDRDRGRG